MEWEGDDGIQMFFSIGNCLYDFIWEIVDQEQIWQGKGYGLIFDCV